MLPNRTIYSDNRRQLGKEIHTCFVRRNGKRNVDKIAVKVEKRAQQDAHAVSIERILVCSSFFFYDFLHDATTTHAFSRERLPLPSQGIVIPFSLPFAPLWASKRVKYLRQSIPENVRAESIFELFRPRYSISSYYTHMFITSQLSLFRLISVKNETFNWLDETLLLWICFKRKQLFWGYPKKHTFEEGIIHRKLLYVSFNFSWTG